MIENLPTVLARIGTHLPLRCEEGDYAEELPLARLAERLTGAAPTPAVDACIALLDRLYAALGLLDDGARVRGCWRFCSYPAYLAACSLLDTLARPDARIFDAGYWAPGMAPDNVDEQRAMLRRLELGRARMRGAAPPARPIRFVHVAWALIRIDGRFLLYRREDVERRDARGHWGLPGGRFRTEDAATPPSPDRLRALAHGEPVAWVDAALPATLERELKEELRLAPGDYRAEDLGDAPPYDAVEGAANHHCLTRYRIRLYRVVFDRRGFVALLDALAAHPQAHAWFDAAELAAQRNARGDQAFLDALRQFDGEPTAALKALGDSYEDRLLLPPSIEGVDLPVAQGQLIACGKTGKPLRTLAVELDADERGWLVGLAWHAKGLPLDGGERAARLPCGWVRLLHDADRQPLRDLGTRLAAAGLELLELLDGSYARLSAPPRSLYFAETLFRYEIEPGASRGGGGWLSVSSDALDTPLGTLRAQRVRLHVGESVLAALRHADGSERAAGAFPASIDRMIRQEIGAPLRDVGLRTLIHNATGRCDQWRIGVRRV